MLLNCHHRVPGVGEKEPAVEKGDTVRVKLDDNVSTGVRIGCIGHDIDDNSWMTLRVQEVDRDTLYFTVRNEQSKMDLKVKKNNSEFLFRQSIPNVWRNWSARSTTVAAPDAAFADWSSC